MIYSELSALSALSLEARWLLSKRGDEVLAAMRDFLRRLTPGDGKCLRQVFPAAGRFVGRDLAYLVVYAKALAAVSGSTAAGGRYQKTVYDSESGDVMNLYHLSFDISAASRPELRQMVELVLELAGTARAYAEDPHTTINASPAVAPTESSQLESAPAKVSAA